MALTLRFRGGTNIPIEVEGVVPDAVAGKSLDEIASWPIYEGNREARLGDFFDVSGDPGDGRHCWQGDLRGVHWIGAKMASGHVVVEGPAGRHVGSEMRGGELIVHGDVGDWLGGEMHGGFIHVRGHAGHLVGAAYRGSARGMTRGTILVEGNVGNEIGHTMRRGLIAIGGNAGDLIGFNMLAGTIMVLGDSGIRHGAGMRRGTIALLGDQRPPLLPSFRKACRYRPLALELLFREIAARGFPISPSAREAEIDLFHGDMIEGGRGEIWLRAA